MSTAAIAAGGVTLAVLYDAAVEQNHQRLQETARGHARMIEAIARHSLANVPPNLSNKDAMQRAEADTLAQVRDAHAHFAGFGKSGEFTLAKRDGDNIVFLLSHRWHDLDNPQPVPFDSDLAEPMRHALRRESGTLFGLDYRGQRVQAA
ncbi:MAG: hypothetical protein H6817_05370, partial [Phycisphaerales bacterium]|nr:hypothetical protein [Phycisphaerales bacterium]